MQIVDKKISIDFLENLLVDNKKIIALFHANWSNYSNQIKKEFLKEEEDSYRDIEKIIIDIDKNGDLVKKLGINQIPSLVAITKDRGKKSDLKISLLKNF